MATANQNVTTQDIGRQAVAQLGLEWGYELGAQFAGEVYAETCARAKFRHLREFGQIFLPDPIQAGTITLTLNTPVIVLDSTALMAVRQMNSEGSDYQWPNGYAGLFFRPQIGITWYKIASASDIDNVGTILLETPFSYDNSYLVGSNEKVQTGVEYYIIPRYQPLNPEARQIGMMMVDYVFRPLRCISEDQMNRMVPSRFLISSYPEYWAELNSNLNLPGIPKQIEVYPYPSASTTLHYTYWKNPPLLGYGDYIPPTIDPDIIRTGTRMFLAGNAMGKAVRRGNIEEAGFWRNISNQERTLYESQINRAVRNDRGAQDLAMTIRRMGWQGPIDYDSITTAFEQFLAQGY